MGSTTYPNSVRFTCDGASGANVVYDVGSYSYLNATVGVPDDADNASGNSITLTFYKDGATADQIGKPITVSLDHTHALHLNLQGAAQLEIACAAISSGSPNLVTMDFALGNATLTS
jgi:hypothetical protein